VDTRAIQNDINKALGLVAKRHGIAFSLQLNRCTGNVLSAALTMSQEVSGDYAQYLAHADHKTEQGHNFYKRRYPGLCDDMLGMVFVVDGCRWIYCGCKMSRPKYPVCMIRVDGTSYSLRKGTLYHLKKMIEQYAPEKERLSKQRVDRAMNEVDPMLSDEAQF
jgi:hypothetical protein